ncbi:hypothetical protein REPUB_Repub11eG0017300 [Reevesia pubescens]
MDYDVYGKYGAFGSCDSTKPTICSCLRDLSLRIERIGIVDVLGLPHYSAKDQTMAANDNVVEENLIEVKLQQQPLFNFDELVNAINNFHFTKKLGHSGFGSVYKGTFEDGKEIAVKRLSKASDQGLEECMNEVVVISKFQHQNLARLLGCCVEGKEKMLVYEYMPNKSLDVFLFG